IAAAYNHGSSLLRQDEAEPLRLIAASQRLYARALPLLQAMEQEMPRNHDWLLECAEDMMQLITELNAAVQRARDVEGTRVRIPRPVTVVRNGTRGRPRQEIDEQWLKNATVPGRALNIAAISRSTRLHRNTIHKKLRAAGFHNRLRFSSITDTNLETLLRAYKTQKPKAGIGFIDGFLRGNVTLYCLLRILGIF
ncbi:hypothetical protein BDZ89DRAFT_961637, partial [Hymenopellis radicata]